MKTILCALLLFGLASCGFPNTDESNTIPFYGDYRVPSSGLVYSLHKNYLSTNVGASYQVVDQFRVPPDGFVTVGQNAPTNSVSPTLWSRFEVQQDGNMYALCLAPEDAPDALTAQNTIPTFGPTGCGGASWVIAKRILATPY